MDKNNQNSQEKDPLELVKEAYGFAEEQLAEEFERAREQTMQQPQPEDVQDRYKKLVNAIEKRGIRPEYLEEEKKRKTVSIRRIWKPLLVAVIAGTLLVGTGITVLGKRYYVYQTRDVDNGKVIQVRNDGQEVFVGEDTFSAYATIEEELGINVLMLSDIPNEFEMEFSEVVNEHGRVKFKSEKGYINFLQMKYDVEMIGIYSSDCETYTEVQNEWLSRNIPVSKNELPNGGVEYRAEFAIGDSFYILSAKTDEDTFVALVEGIVFYKGGQNDGN